MTRGLSRSFSADVAAGYLAGFIDGEGCVYSRRATLPNGKHHQHRVVTITNTDPVLIDVAAECLDALGIEYGRSDRPGATLKHRHRYTIEIRKGAAMFRLRERVPICSPDKLVKLDVALETYRGLHCSGCGCLHDEKTEGCVNCRKRHYFRDRYQARKHAV
jgi:hypothetical protein